MNWFRKLFRSTLAPEPPPAHREVRRRRRLRESDSDLVDSDIGYRRLTSADSRRDLSPVKHDRMLRIAHYLWRSNPIAKRAISNMRAFVASEGFRLRATSPNENYRAQMQRELDRHWELWRWDEMLTKRVETLAVEGEWIYLVLPPSRFSGHSVPGKILPELVQDIQRDPMDAETLRTIVLSAPVKIHQPDGTVRVTSELEIVHRGSDGMLRGDVLYLATNQLSGQTRGWSDLLCVADWLDQLDTLLFTEVERVQFQRAFVWSVEIDAESEEALERRKEELKGEGPPSPGTVLAHSKTEQWQCLSPNLQMQDSVTFIKFVMMICFGGLSMPEHYFAEGGDVNKATSTNMTPPIFAWVRDRKRAVRLFMETAAELAVQNLVEVGVLSSIPEAHRTWEVVSRDPERTAYDVLGQMLSTLAQALTLAVEAGWVKDHEAARAFRTAASDMGLGDFPVVSESEDTLDDAQKAASERLEHRRPSLDQLDDAA